MKNIFTSFVLVMSIASTSFASPMVEEVGYDQLVRELQTSKAKAPRPQTFFTNSNNYQMSFGLTQSQSSYQLSGQNAQPSMTGISIAGGMKLQDQWIGEGQLTFFSGASSQGMNASAQDASAKLMFVNSIDKDWFFRAGPGANARLSQLSRQNSSSSSLSLGGLLEGGLGYRITPTISAGASLSARSAFINNNNDKGSFDITLGIETKL